MRDQFSAELLKARSGFGIPLLLTVALVLAATSQFGTVSTALHGDPDPAALSHQVLGLGFSVVLFAMLGGALLVTNEYRSGAIGRSVLQAPSRGAVVGAKLGASALVGLLFGATAALGSVAACSGALAAHHRQLVLDGRSWAILGAVVLVCLFGGPWGAAAGFLLRGQTVTMLTLVVWTTTLETMVLKYLPQLGRFLPGGAQMAVLGDPSLPQRLAAPAGVLLLALWGALAAVGGHWLFTRRDLG